MSKASPATVVEGSLATTSVEAAAAETLNDELTAEVRLPLDAVSVYPVPARFILRSVKVATPFTAGTVAVPKRLAPAAPVPDVMLTVTESVADVTVFPSESVIMTTGWVVNVLQATAPDGCVEKARVGVGWLR